MGARREGSMGGGRKAEESGEEGWAELERARNSSY